MLSEGMELFTDGQSPKASHRPPECSTWLCCAHAISEEGTHVLGAQAGEARLAQVCREAGFSRVRQIGRAHV